FIQTHMPEHPVMEAIISGDRESFLDREIDMRRRGVLPPFGLLMGLHLFWTGADHPGGAFQGGALLAAMWLLVLLAGLGREPVSRAWPVRLLVVAGPGLFIAAGFLGSVLGGGFLSYPPGWEKPVIIAIEAALTFSIAVTLGLLVLGPPQRAPAT
ncbi:MAG: hypothetical protein B7Z53_06060, partial [Rhodospirillales bacterium 12-71-4]